MNPTSNTHEPSILMQPVKPARHHFVEYEKKANQNHAYLFPSDEKGTVFLKRLTEATLNVLSTIVNNPNDYTNMGVKTLRDGGMPLMIVCSCGTTVVFPEWEQARAVCSHCEYVWNRYLALVLPQAERI